ncbi:MAG: hypothetical protein ACRC2K_07830 [Clostridium sp.]
MNLLYCESCTRVFSEDGDCPYCQGSGIAMKKNSPVNIIGTKLKGKVFNAKNGKVFVIIRAEDNSKIMKEYSPNNLRKIV